MRKKGSRNGVTALAVAGTNVVVLGWDMSEEDIRTRGILGFAIQRTRHEDGEKIWLSGLKTFESVDPHPDPGVPVSSFRHPLQTFQWSDYTPSPWKKYTYRIVAMGGQPGALVEAADVSLEVTTERIDQGKHAIFFNRGAIASQEYARRFQNLPPNQVGHAAYDWLSRGLVEGLEAFLSQAGQGDELYGAIFEFENKRIHVAIRAAHDRGAKIKILYDGDSQREGNEDALKGSGIAGLTKARTRSGQFAHNKFFVLRRAGKFSEVWTGSTNLSDNGIFGHSNNAHIIRDQKIADAYFAYWEVLNKDKTVRPTATASTAISPTPPQQINTSGDTVAVFSPRTDLAALDWYAQLAGNAERALFTTFAFGMNSRFVTVYDQTDDVLRFALMEKKGNGRNYKVQAAEVDRIRKRPNTIVAVGNYITTNAFDRWLKEIDRVQDDVHVRFVHTKYMLIDPLGSKPIVIVGSANFSKASTDTNDENMLVIENNDAVSDIYLGEFMRLFSHYAFRESLTFKKSNKPADILRRKHLKEDHSWIDGDGGNSGYFVQGFDRALRRLYFSGQ